LKPALFDYARPGTLTEALAALETYGDEAKILAGGQSLVPAMNFRLAYPAVLVDISQIDELHAISAGDRWLTIGATVTQRELERSLDLQSNPVLAAALPWIGHLQTRNRGTVAGSLAHADPAAELPAAAVASGAEIDVASPTGTRVVPAGDFFQGPFTTELRAGEIVVAVRFPSIPTTRGVCDEVVRRHGDFAIAGVAMQAVESAGTISDVSLASFGIGGAPTKLSATEAALEGQELRPELAAIAGRTAAEEVEEPWSDIHATGDYRRQAVGALVSRMVAGL